MIWDLSEIERDGIAYSEFSTKLKKGEYYYMSNITANEEILLLQCLSTTALLGELANDNFLESEYFKKLTFSNENCKTILEQSGLGNPATMQMMLYALLIVPKELLSRSEYRNLETYVEKINLSVPSIIEQGTYSTYKGEKSLEKINYFRHIRNAVAHSKCEYINENAENYVVFEDNLGEQNCGIKMKCCNVGYLLMELQKLIMTYYNERHS